MFVEMALFFVVLLVFLVLRDKKPSAMPPGPVEFPFLGQVPEMKSQYLMNLRKRFGDIVTTRVGALRTVYFYDFDTAKAVLAKTEAVDRPLYFGDFMVDDKQSGGVAMSNGVQWHHDRRFMIRNLRNFGMGKSYLEQAIDSEAQALVEDLKKYAEEPITYPDSFRTAPLNVIWQMMASRRYDLRSNEVQAFYQATRDLFSEIGLGSMIKSWFPILGAVPLPEFINRRVFCTHLSDNYRNTVGDIVDEAIAEHKKDFVPGSPRDLIDEYLAEMTEAEEKGEPHLFRKGALAQIIADGFDAGSDTVNYSLRWIVYLLCRYPEMAQRMRQQLSEAVGEGAGRRQVTTQDKPSLPLIESFITEVIRYSCFVLTTFERMAGEDFMVEGYLVPKGTVLKCVIYAMHFDPEMFPDPTEFKVDRFLDQDGKYVAPKKGIFLFGSGRRLCPGENLARVELFLFTAAILQNFDIVVPAGATLDAEVNELEIGLRVPKEQKLIYKIRS